MCFSNPISHPLFLDTLYFPPIVREGHEVRPRKWRGLSRLRQGKVPPVFLSHRHTGNTGGTRWDPHRPHSQVLPTLHQCSPTTAFYKFLEYASLFRIQASIPYRPNPGYGSLLDQLLIFQVSRPEHLFRDAFPKALSKRRPYTPSYFPTFFSVRAWHGDDS